MGLPLSMADLHEPHDQCEGRHLSRRPSSRDEIAQRASGLVRYRLVAEGRAAVHAAGSLGLNSHLPKRSILQTTSSAVINSLSPLSPRLSLPGFL